MELKLKGTDILITGGYRTVGRRVPADLAPDYAGRVVAGWSAEEVAQLAVDLGHGGRERQVDVGDCGTYWPGELSSLPVSVRTCKNLLLAPSTSEQIKGEKGHA